MNEGEPNTQQELEELKKEVSANLKRIRNSRALTALAIFAVAALLLDAQIELKDNKLNAQLKTQRYSASEIIYLAGIAGVSLGVISIEDLLNLIRKK